MVALLDGEEVRLMEYDDYEYGVIRYNEDQVEAFSEKVWNAAIEEVCKQFALDVEKEIIRKVKL